MLNFFKSQKTRINYICSPVLVLFFFLDAIPSLLAPEAAMALMIVEVEVAQASVVVVVVKAEPAAIQVI